MCVISKLLLNTGQTIRWLISLPNFMTIFKSIFYDTYLNKPPEKIPSYSYKDFPLPTCACYFTIDNLSAELVSYLIFFHLKGYRKT